MALGSCKTTPRSQQCTTVTEDWHGGLAPWGWGEGPYLPHGQWGAGSVRLRGSRQADGPPEPKQRKAPPSGLLQRLSSRHLCVHPVQTRSHPHVPSATKHFSIHTPKKLAGWRSGWNLPMWGDCPAKISCPVAVARGHVKTLTCRTQGFQETVVELEPVKWGVYHITPEFGGLK